MDWFKHWNNETEENEGLQQLISARDFETAFIYWWLREQISKFEKPENRGRITLNIPFFKRKLGLNSQRTLRVLTKIDKTFEMKITVNLDQTVEVFEPNWLKSQENRGGKKQPKEPQNSSKNEQKKEERTKSEEKKETKKPATPDLHPLALLWNQHVQKLSKVKETSEKRNQKIQRVWSVRTPEKWVEALKKIADSKFCHGDNERGWKADFDWILQDDVYFKIMEGKYDNREKRTTGTHKGQFNNQRAGEDLANHSAFTTAGDQGPAQQSLGADLGGTRKDE